MIHAITVLLLMVCLAGVAGYIPLACLSAMLLVISWNMSEKARFLEILQGPRSDALVLIATYLLTVLVDITVAVQVGVLLAAILFLKHMSEQTTVTLHSALQEEMQSDGMENPEAALSLSTIPEGIQVFEIEGPFFFGVADILNEMLSRVVVTPKAFILRLRSVPLIDASGVQAIVDFAKRCERLHIAFYLTELKPELEKRLAKSPLKPLLNAHTRKPTLAAAIVSAEEQIRHREACPSTA